MDRVTLSSGFALRSTAQRRAVDVSGWYLLFFQAADAVATVAALWLAAELRRQLPFGPLLAGDGWAGLHVYVIALVVSSAAYILSGVYRAERLESIGTELIAALRASAVGITLLAGLLYFMDRSVSRWLFVYYGAIKIGLVIGLRLAVRAACGALGWPLTRSHRTLIVGAGAIGRNAARHLARAAGSKYRVLGFLDDSAERLEAPDLPPILGTLDRAEAIARDLKIDEILIALPLSRSHAMAHLMTAIQSLPLQVKVIPDYFDLAYLYARSDDVAGLPVIHLKEPVLSPRQRAFKRAFDLMVGSGLLALAAPVLLIAATAIKLDSAGPALYRQKRLGEGGRRFDMLKLRTMVCDADRHEHGLIEVNGHSVQFNKRRDDPRVTRAGAWLRRWSIDELPQLWNVLKGDLSLVGPRPELPSLVERYTAWQHKRFAVPQGITGWWQVNGRPQDVSAKVEYDLYYVRHYSTLLDIWILIRTVAAVLRRTGAF